MKLLSCVRLFETPWTIAYEAPPSVGFSRQECWRGVPFPSPGDLPDPGIKPGSPALEADALTSEPPGEFSIPTDLVGMTIQRALFRNLFFSWFGLLHALLNVISQFIHPLRGLPWWLSGKEPACQCRRRGFDLWVRKISWRRKWQPTPMFWRGKSHGQRSLAG